jgi:hypothetical protein
VLDGVRGGSPDLESSPEVLIWRYTPRDPSEGIDRCKISATFAEESVSRTNRFGTAEEVSVVDTSWK